MKKNIQFDGSAYRLRSVQVDDAEFIISTRLEDIERNKFISPISEDISLQRKWIEAYLLKEDDYYFVIENCLTGNKEGLIGIYNILDNKAEWGRWVLKKGSLAALESVNLIFKFAFNKLSLDEIYSRTITGNIPVISFHNSLPQLKRGTLKEEFNIKGIVYDAFEHYVTKSYYLEKLQVNLEQRIHLIFQRNFRALLGKLNFHHIGVATQNIEKEFETYQMLGYRKESNFFEDHEQGIRGLFIVADGQPRLELLDNLSGSTTLDIWLERKVKMYHFAYQVQDIEKVIDIFNKNKIKIVSPLKQSVYFRKRIAFLLLKNMYLIELIEA